jgi:arginase
MRLTVFQIPYDAGRYGQRMGRGPLHLIERGLVRDLEAQGHNVDLQPLRLPEGVMPEAGAAAEIQRQLSRAAVRARTEGRLPIVLTGNCNATLGALAAHAPGTVGLVWLDAHADFNTPETTTSGFFDGMALSMITGGAWQALASSVPHFHPIAERDVVLVGARDLDSAEEERLARSHIARVAAADVPDALQPAFEHLARRINRIHLHVDLDVLDPSVGRANPFACPNGLSLVQADLLVAAAGACFEIGSVTFSAYDPDHDPDDRIVRAVGSLLAAVLEASGT